MSTNTTTCHVCSQSVPLDDSGRLKDHALPIVPATLCPGSGTTPQAPDGAEKAETPTPLTDEASSKMARWKARDMAVMMLGSHLDSDDPMPPNGWNTARELECILVQAREKIAGLEKDGKRLDFLDGPDCSLRALADQMKATDCFSFRTAIDRALDAARDKKGTE